MPNRTRDAVPPLQRRRGFCGVLIAAILALSSGCAEMRTPLPRVSDLQVEAWHELRSPDFVLYSRGPREDLEAFALDLSRFIAVVNRFVVSQPPKTRAHIFLVDDRAEQLFIRYRSVKGFMSHSLIGFDGVMDTSDHDPVSRGIFLHEFTHYLTLRNRLLKYPSWYVEGFAEFLGPTRTRDDVVEIGSRPSWRTAQLETARARGRWINLETIFGFEKRGRWRFPAEFYAASWATVHYLNSNPERRSRMISMIDLQASGESWERAYAQSFADPIDDLSDAVNRHVGMILKGTPATLFYIPLESLEVRTDYEVRAVPPGEATRMLGELALREGVYGDSQYSWRLAEALLLRSLALDPTNPRTAAALAASLSRQGRFEEAEVQLALFRHATDPSATALIHAGDAALHHASSLERDEDKSERTRLYTSAVDLYRRALSSQPDNPVALAGLGRSQFGLEEFDSARESLAKAQSLGEWDAALTIDRGLLELAAGSPGRARAYWREVMRLGDAYEAEHASDLLEEHD